MISARLRGIGICDKFSSSKVPKGKNGNACLPTFQRNSSRLCLLSRRTLFKSNTKRLVDMIWSHRPSQVDIAEVLIGTPLDGATISEMRQAKISTCTAAFCKSDAIEPGTLCTPVTDNRYLTVAEDKVYRMRLILGHSFPLRAGSCLHTGHCHVEDLCQGHALHHHLYRYNCAVCNVIRETFNAFLIRPGTCHELDEHGGATRTSIMSTSVVQTKCPHSTQYWTIHDWLHTLVGRWDHCTVMLDQKESFSHWYVMCATSPSCNGKQGGACRLCFASGWVFTQFDHWVVNLGLHFMVFPVHLGHAIMLLHVSRHLFSQAGRSSKMIIVSLLPFGLPDCVVSFVHGQLFSVNSNLDIACAWALDCCRIIMS